MAATTTALFGHSPKLLSRPLRRDSAGRCTIAPCSSVMRATKPSTTRSSTRLGASRRNKKKPAADAPPAADEAVPESAAAEDDEEEDDAVVVTSDMSFESDRPDSLSSSTFEIEDSEEGPPAKVILSDRSIDYEADESDGGETPTEPATDAAVPSASPSLSSSSSSSSFGDEKDAEEEEEPPVITTPFKMQLLSYVASLDRGIVAFPPQQREVDRLCASLEATGSGGVDLAADYGAAMSLLKGRWRLVYSSGFGSGSLGGRQPGPPAAVVPFSIGQVYQDIDVGKEELDNVVQLCFRTPTIPFLQEDDPEPVIAEITLGHTFKVTEAATVTITFETTAAKVSGPIPMLSDALSFAVPQLPEALQPPRGLRSASFDVTFLDGDMRITRGDRGELRVYVRA